MGLLLLLLLLHVVEIQNIQKNDTRFKECNKGEFIGNFNCICNNLFPVGVACISACFVFLNAFLSL